MIHVVLFPTESQHAAQLWGPIQQPAMWLYCVGAVGAFCPVKVQLLHTQAISGLKWETVLIEPQTPNKRGLTRVRPLWTVSAQKHHSATSAS